MTALIARRSGVVAALAAALLLALAGPAFAHARGLTTGFTDEDSFQSPDAGTRALWLGRARADGARTILLIAYWSSIATHRPQHPTSPGDTAYTWGGLDAQVRDVEARGMNVILTVTSAPAWAEGANPPRGYTPGTWRPDPTAFGQFATAIASRYSGSYRPPGTAAALPRVRDFQAWAEPNLPEHLEPQWVRSGQRLVAESPLAYRAMLNAFYTGVKAVHADDLVITAGTAPFGDPNPGHARIQPATFVRALLCIGGGRRLRPLRCPNPAHFDVLAHHPYDISSPSFHAILKNDVSVPDMARLTGPLHVAERTGRALPRGPKQVWVTEFSYISKPPNPTGVPIQTQARWLEQAFFLLWKEGVNTVIWYLIRDQPLVIGNYESGVYFIDGSPKPAVQAFRFPFVTSRLSHGRLEAWGKAPVGGHLLIERLAGSRWYVVARRRVRANQVFDLRLRARGTMRAVVGRQASLPY